jgi:glyoxylase-like metal-dependent hydrolase (beta-lactamase superfamily II)
MRVTLLSDGTYASNCYLVSDDALTGAILVDPSVDPAVAEVPLAEFPKIDTIVLTHGHFDHMLALQAWRELTGAPVAITAEDAAMLLDPALSCYRSFLGEEITHAPADLLLSDGERLAVGSEALTVIATPGHTPGSIVLDSGDLLFTGDTVFAGGGYGRFDLPGGDGRLLAASIRRLMSIDGERRLLAGHGPEGTLSAEKKFYHFS